MRRAAGTVICALLLFGCGGGNGSGSIPGTESIAGVTWTPPENWTKTHDLPMRIATYTIPQAEGDYEPGECAVFYFGKGQGGDIDMNIERWGSQFTGESTAEKTTTVINDLNVVIVRIAGTYLAPSGPNLESQGLKPDYRLLGAIIEAPEGTVFFKCTGPRKTITEAESKFMTMMNSLIKVGG